MPLRLCLHSVLALGILCFVAEPVLAVDPSADTTAKLLAGLAVPAAGNPLASEDPWMVHSRELDRAWQRTQQQLLPAIANWAQSFLGPAYRDTATVFYMFSGPDFLNAQAFFANAHTYILCGKEPVGAVQDVNQISPEALPATLANLRKSLASVLNFNFFITKDMKTDLADVQLSGTLPLLYVMLARTGYTIDSVAPVTIDQSGNVSESSSGQIPGVRISVINSSGLQQAIYYFCTDVSDDGIKANPGFLRFCENQGRGSSLLKAASYLMHEPGFSRVRDFLLRQSDLIVQDDSGIPLRYFDDQNWTIRYCGNYVGPINVFKQHWQPDLAKAYAQVTRTALPFSFGYQWQPNRSDLMIVARNGTDTGAVANRVDEPNQRVNYVAESVPAQTEYRPPPPRRDSRPDASKTKERLIPRM